jgi:hypothetical protein
MPTAIVPVGSATLSTQRPRPACRATRSRALSSLRILDWIGVRLHANRRAQPGARRTACGLAPPLRNGTGPTVDPVCLKGAMPRRAGACRRRTALRPELLAAGPASNCTLLLMRAASEFATRSPQPRGPGRRLWPGRATRVGGQPDQSVPGAAAHRRTAGPSASLPRVSRRLPGHSLAAAHAIAAEARCPLRVVIQDGRGLPVTEDFSASRINVGVDDTRVSEIVGLF